MKHGEILLYGRWRNHPVRCSEKTLFFRYRIDPVPFTGGYKWNFSSFYKTPRTANERRKSYACDPSFVRVKRNSIYLPNAWDDRTRSDYYDKKSWKKSCKVRKQWMKHIGRKPWYESEYPDMFRL